MTKGEALAARFEGFRAKPYLCPAGVPTIGYGSTRYPDGQSVKLSDPPIREERAAGLLSLEFGRAVRSARRLVGPSIPLRPDQTDALADFVYNLGPAALGGSTLLRKLKRGDDFGNEWGRWVRGGGRVLPGLVARRQAERILYDNAG